MGQVRGVANRQAQCEVRGNVGEDVGGGDGSLVAEFEGIRQGLAVADAQVPGGELRGDVGQPVAQQQFPQPEEAVVQVAVDRARRIDRRVYLHVGVDGRDGRATVAAVGADARAQAVPVIAVVQRKGLRCRGIRRLDQEVAVGGIVGGHHGPQVEGRLSAGERDYVQRRRHGVGDADQREGQIEVDQAAAGGSIEAIFGGCQGCRQVPLAAGPFQQHSGTGVPHPNQIVGPHRAALQGRRRPRQVDDRAIPGIGIDRRDRTARAHVHIDEEITAVLRRAGGGRIPVRAGPGQAQRFLVPCDVELLLGAQCRLTRRATADAAIHTDQRATAVHPTPVQT